MRRWRRGREKCVTCIPSVATQKTSAWQQQRPNTRHPLVHSQHNVLRPPPIRAAITTCKGRLKFYAHKALSRIEQQESVLGIDCARAGVPNCGARERKREGLSAKCTRKQKGLWPAKEFNYSGFGRRTNWIAPLSPAFYRCK
jgi:hypothetical protein